MHIKRFALMVVMLFAASTSYALDCVIFEKTLGFKDTEALSKLIQAAMMSKLDGDGEPHAKLAAKLLVEGRVDTLDGGERVRILAVDYSLGETTALIRTKDKREWWIKATDLKCWKQK